MVRWLVPLSLCKADFVVMAGTRRCERRKKETLDAIERTKNIVTSFAIKKPWGKSGFSSPPKIEPHKELGYCL